MLRLRDFVSQYTVVLTQACALRCHGCALWTSAKASLPQTAHVADTTLIQLIQDHAFFDVFPRVATYHIIGGDPVESTVMDLLITYLTAHGIRTIVWSPGLQLSSMRSLQHISTVGLFIPAIDKHAYRRYTGWDGWEAVTEALQTLKDHRIPTIAVTTVHPETLPILPDIREWCWQRNLPWLLTFYKDEGYSKDALAHIYHYRQVPGVWVIPEKKRPKNRCIHIPYTGLQTPRMWWYGVWQDMFRRIRRWAP